MLEPFSLLVFAERDTNGSEIDLSSEAVKSDDLAQNLPYEPEAWNNNADIVANSNCYMYAINLKMDREASNSPGGLSGYGYVLTDISKITAYWLKYYVEADAEAQGFTFEEIGKYETCPNGTYKVALYVDPYNDYHWYRQNPDGTWSHKPGGTNVVRIDGLEDENTPPNGKLIFDPDKAERKVLDMASWTESYYSELVGYFAVSPLNSLSNEGAVDFASYEEMTTVLNYQIIATLPSDAFKER